MERNNLHCVSKIGCSESVSAFPLQEIVGHFRGAGTFRLFSTAGTAPVGPLSGQFSGDEISTYSRVRYFCVALQLLGGACSDGGCWLNAT